MTYDAFVSTWLPFKEGSEYYYRPNALRTFMTPIANKNIYVWAKAVIDMRKWISGSGGQKIWYGIRETGVGWSTGPWFFIYINNYKSDLHASVRLRINSTNYTDGEFNPVVSDKLYLQWNFNTFDGTPGVHTPLVELICWDSEDKDNILGSYSIDYTDIATLDEFLIGKDFEFFLYIQNEDTPQTVGAMNIELHEPVMLDPEYLDYNEFLFGDFPNKRMVRQDSLLEQLVVKDFCLDGT